jgi:hypothetical protein
MERSFCLAPHTVDRRAFLLGTAALSCSLALPGCSQGKGSAGWAFDPQGEAKTAAPAFLPISLTAPAKSVDTNCDPSASEAPATDSRIEIELANGRRVRVGPGADMNALKRILDIADGRQRP